MTYGPDIACLLYSPQVKNGATFLNGWKNCAHHSYLTLNGFGISLCYRLKNISI